MSQEVSVLEVSVQGVYVPGVSVQGVSVQGVYVLEVSVRGAHVRGDYVLEPEKPLQGNKNNVRGLNVQRNRYL